MYYLGDFSSTGTVAGEWGTYDSSGNSVAASSTGVLTVFEATSTAAATLGLTDNRAYRGVTGQNNFTIDLTATGFFVPGQDYVVLASSLLVDGSTVSAALAQFSIRNRFMRGTDNAHLAADVATNSSLMSISTAGVVQADINSTAQTFDQTGDVLGNVNDVLTLPVNSSLGVVSTGGIYSADLSSTTQTFDRVGDLQGSVTSVSSAVGGSFLPVNSSLAVISTDGVANSNPVLIAGSSTGIDNIKLNLDAAITTRSTIASSEVNAEVLDVLNTDAFGAASGSPPASTTLQGKITRMYDAMRGRLHTNSSELVFYSAGSTTEQWRKTLTDDGTTYTEGEATT